MSLSLQSVPILTVSIQGFSPRGEAGVAMMVQQSRGMMIKTRRHWPCAGLAA